VLAVKVASFSSEVGWGDRPSSRYV